MSQTISAIFENGVIRPLEPVKLVNGEEVEVLLLDKAHDPTASRKLLAGIAKLPIEGKADKFSGEDHDRLLYLDE